ncbi:sensor histidine kinase [Couchioplanes caeruleus]|uniref:histidine kinase n=2 Tax=Couchioplanes caeruleus TaxID=56438 RepID=A0A1K0FQQ7_9ACTN|nr:HAMP domain-containing sensor histidine kinase [Couchioplanes caeruleus]OJF15016.1 two-component sensor histidine kinase [Couchioplanes caeruleus subsp. caeruleus]ROP28928.1 two-component system sensor histidine kinase BaeS [Couchioplanes caeruleus]
MSRAAGARRVPLHRSLITRLLATSVLVAVAAIVATAWLATQTVTRAIQQEQGRSLADDKSVYDTLVGFAATHRDWTGVDVVVAERAAKLGRRITLMTEDRRPIADSAPGPSLAAARPSATVDPLRLDLALTGSDVRIDPRVVGPYRLPADERTALDKAAQDQLACLRESGTGGELVNSPTGRPSVRTSGSIAELDVGVSCDRLGELGRTRTEEKALSDLERRAAPCLGLDDRSFLRIDTDFTARVLKLPNGGSLQDTSVADKAARCIERARQAQLKQYVAPPALLFVTDPDDKAGQPVFNLSRTNTLRIAVVTGAVLVVAVLVTILAGRRLVRPLRALTAAADGPADHHSRVPVTTADEIGYLARALNDLAERRKRSESLRRAMVSDVAHELRTPLTNIRSWLEAAQDGLTTTGPGLLELLHEEAVQLQHIIDDLSDLAAADAGNLRVHRDEVYVRDILAQVAEAHRSAAETAGVRLSMEVADDPQVMADPVRLRQLVGNLVSNGIRHTPAGGAVTVSAATDDAGLTVEVRDTGTGIAAEDLPKIFDRFWRADRSRNRATGGSGLGLSIVRKLVEAHGGEISVTSEPAAGTVFTVRLPSAVSADPGRSP